MYFNCNISVKSRDRKVDVSVEWPININVKNEIGQKWSKSSLIVPKMCNVRNNFNCNFWHVIRNQQRITI